MPGYFAGWSDRERFNWCHGDKYKNNDDFEIAFQEYRKRHKSFLQQLWEFFTSF